MKRFDDTSEPSRRTPVRWLLLALIAAGVFLALKRGPGDETRQEASRSAASGQAVRPLGAAAVESRRSPAPPAATAVAVNAAAFPPSIPPGHEGHGDNCAECLAARRLAACREDYAQLCYTQLAEAYEFSGEKAPQLLDACRRFAASVLKEWSFSESKPLLPPDEIVEARRREFVSPLLAGLAAKQEDTR